MLVCLCLHDSEAALLSDCSPLHADSGGSAEYQDSAQGE